MTEEIKCLIEKMTEVVKGKEKDVDPEKDLLRENVRERDRLDERENDHPGEFEELFHVTQFSFQSFL